MVKRVNLYYSAKAIESAVELKNSSEDWQRAASAQVSPNDGEVQLALAVPIVTSNLVIEFAELHEVK